MPCKVSTSLQTLRNTDFFSTCATAFDNSYPTLRELRHRTNGLASSLKTTKQQHLSAQQRWASSHGHAEKGVNFPSYTGAPVLHGTHDFDTYACNDQIGCVFLYKQAEDTKTPVRYWSLPPTVAKNWCNTTQHECVLIPRFVILLQPYLEGQCLTVCTDQDALNWIPTSLNL